MSERVCVHDGVIPEQIRQIYPYQGRWAKVLGHRMHYLDEGPREGNSTVLLLHGNPTWSFLYREIIPRIQDSCRTVAPDYLGMGLSDKPVVERFCSLENHIRDIWAFLEWLVQGVDGEWSVAALRKTAAIYKSAGAPERG